MRYRILQRVSKKRTVLPIEKEEIDLNDYEETYQGHVFGNKTTLKALDELFVLFNCEKRPTIHVSSSLSINDIIEIEGQKYLCEIGGWGELL